MRDNEVETLPFGCLITEQLNGQIHNIAVGETYKFTSGVGRRAKWIIGADAARGIQLAQKISKCVFTIAGIDKVDGNIPEDKHPLFVSLLYLRFSLATRPSTLGGHVKRTSGLHLKDHRAWILSFDLRIVEEDVNELNNLDPFRDWKREPYTVGNHWPLATHQLRRSLALYASRSGLVSLPSLRRQLKHITQEMSIYYAKGSQFSKNFLGNPDSAEQRHFSVELQETKAESEMLSFLLNVIDSDERLFGGQGAFWQRQKERRNVQIATVDRKKTLKEFSNGLRTYQVTPLGGCGKVGECQEKAMGSFMECVVGDRSSFGDAKPCKYSYIKVSRLCEVIVSQENRLIQEEQLGIGSMYYKDTLDDLNVLRNYLTKIQN